jgi:ABC-type nickel/cobalt efflux system permease component RcnA
MMTTTLATALILGLTHTILGPDHYLPFIVIGRARRWGLGRTALLTAVCGAGHVASSVVIGMLGAAAGTALTTLEGLEGVRGELAGWGLLAFGGGYTIFGLWRVLRGAPHGHRHAHVHQDGRVHAHGHDHAAAGHPAVHAHEHERPGAVPEPATWKQLTPWLLFLVFVLGPCEPLIPLFFADAVAGDWTTALLLAAAYGAATLAAMLVIVTLFWVGLRRLPLGPLERFGHVVAGGVILIAGIGMVFLGW